MNLLMLFFFGLGQSAWAAERNGVLAARVQKEIAGYERFHPEVAVQVYDLERGREVLSLNADRLMKPASLVKIFTAAAALEEWGPAGTIPTEIYAPEELSAGAVSALYLKGYGDPKLVQERLWLLSRELVNRGLTRVAGDLVVDDGYFAVGPEAAPGEKVDSLRPYAAPLSAASLNFNTVTVHTEPNPEGSSIKLVFDPACDYFKWENRLTTAKGGGEAAVNIARQFSGAYDTFLFSGRLPSGSTRRTFYLNISSPALYLGSFWRRLLEAEGVRVAGKASRGATPSGLQPILTFASEPVWKLAADMNKFSNNFMAEEMALAMAARRYGPPATRDKAARYLTEYLMRQGIQNSSFHLEDACGLSHHNRLSARQINDFLVKVWREKRSVAPEVMTAMALAGEDGTLRRRLKEASGSGSLRAKTGSLSGVATLAGFWSAEPDILMAITVLINGERMSLPDLLALRDGIVMAVARARGHKETP